MIDKKSHDNRTASQRLEDLEKAMLGFYQSLNQMGSELNMTKEAVKLLGNKVDSIVKAVQRGQGLNDETISQIMIENNMAELKQKVENYKTLGYFVPADQVDDNTFIVGRELDPNGQVVQPRMQFGYAALQGGVKDKMKGAKAGDVVDFGEGKYKFEVQELYSVVDPNVNKGVQENAAAASTVEVYTDTSADTSSSVTVNDDSSAVPAEVENVGTVSVDNVQQSNVSG